MEGDEPLKVMQVELELGARTAPRSPRTRPFIGCGWATR